MVQEYERAVIFRLGRFYCQLDIQIMMMRMTVIISVSKNSEIYVYFSHLQKIILKNSSRLRSGGAKGPGLFFIVPCIDQYR